MSYHQGITWPWLCGLYYDSLKAVINVEKNKIKKKELEEKYKDFVKKLKENFPKMLYKDGCVGSISELYDSNSAHLPKGAFAQAWSVAEVYRILLENREK